MLATTAEVFDLNVVESIVVRLTKRQRMATSIGKKPHMVLVTTITMACRTTPPKEIEVFDLDVDGFAYDETDRETVGQNYEGMQNNAAEGEGGISSQC